MRIVFLNKIDELWKPYVEKLKGKFPDIELISSLDFEKPEKYIPGADGIVCVDHSADFLKVAKNLKVIFVPWTGVDSFLVDEVVKRGIMVSNTHGNAKIVAERALALCLALLGRIVEFHENLSRGVWGDLSKNRFYDNLWVSLRNKKCGIAGFGNIGKELAKLLKVFNCEITAFKKHLGNSEDLKLADKVTNNLEEMILKSEIIFITLPLTDETKDMFNWDILSKMRGKYLINVGRGAVVSEIALYEALKKSILKGVAIDTWYNYPSADKLVTLPFSYPIHSFNNVVLSPHVGSSTIEGFKAMREETIENIVAFINTGRPKHLVDLELKY